MMADTAELRKRLFEEMKGRIKEDNSSVPMKDGPFAYGSSYKKGGEQPRFFRTPREGGAEEIILDGDAEAEGKPYFRIGGSRPFDRPSPAALGLRRQGLGILHACASATSRPARISPTTSRTPAAAASGTPRTTASSTRASTRTTVRPRLFFHALGADVSQDRLVYEESDPGFFMNVGGSRSNDWIFISINDHETSEFRLLRTDDPTATPKLVAARETGLQYDLEEGGDVFFILTNADGAKDFKIMTAPVADPTRAELDGTRAARARPADPVAPRASRISSSASSARTACRASSCATARPARSTCIAFDEEAFSLSLLGSYEYDTDIMRFSYSSMTTPAQVFDYDMRTRERVLLKTQEVPSGHDPDHYVTRRLMAPSHDGELVPVSLIYHRDTPLDGSAPCLLYGYGSYGITIPAAFNTNILSLADRGFVYAIAHVRGGKDKGFSWYEDGKRDKKTNTFLDFIAVARHLVARGYTSHDRIVAQGGSAGGMLMGAIANMAPEAFGGIIAEVPFVDVLTTMLDDTLPLTPPEWPEWGNPIASEKDYKTIAAYSPYDNVGALDYPPILAVAGLTDPRVTYWEPAKWVARLRGSQARRQSGAVQDQHGFRPCRRIRTFLPAGGDRLRLCLRAEGRGQDGERQTRLSHLKPLAIALPRR